MSSTDLALLRAWLRGLNDDGFVALPPATRDGGPFDAADVGVAAAEEAEARGLSPDVSWVGWHNQSHAFEGGRLTGVQHVYHGGDLAEVRRRLSTLPDRFELGGGGSEDEAFTIAVRFDPSAIDLTDDDAVDSALTAMETDRHWYGDHPRMRLRAPLADGAVTWLHAVVADGATAGHRARAFALLDSQDAVTDGELDEAVRALRAGVDQPPAAPAHVVVNLLRERGRLGDAATLATDLATALHDRGEPGAGSLLVLAPTTETVEVARRIDAHVAEARIAAALDGNDAWAVGVEIAERLSSQGVDGAAVDRFIVGLQTLTPAPFDPAPTTEAEAARLAALLTEPRLPERQRAVLLAWTRRLPEGHVYRSAGAGTVAALDAAVAEAGERLAAAGLDGWCPPIGLDSPHALWETLGEVRDLSPAQEEWFRATLLAPPAAAADVLDAYLLEALVACGRFTMADGDALLKGWRRRFVRRPGPYARVQPALISLVIGLFEAEHPRAEEVWTAVMQLKQAWARPLQLLLTMYEDVDDAVLERLRGVIVDGDLYDQPAAIVAYLFLYAEQAEAEPFEAAVSYVLGEAPGAEVAVRFALELLAGNPRLLSPRYVHPAVAEAGRRAIADDELPADFLRRVARFVGDGARGTA